jgi:hypothetical protein
MLLLPIYVGFLLLSGITPDYLSQMNELQIQHRTDLPANFLRKFWIESGVAFESFLSRCKTHGWLFSIEVPEGDGNNNAMVDAINEGVQTLAGHGGPTLPKPEGHLNRDGERRWDFLSCKSTNQKVKELRGRQSHEQNSNEKLPFIEIKPSNVLLAPVDFTVKTVTKLLGFKNILKENPDEPEKFVAIGRWPTLSFISPLVRYVG